MRERIRVTDESIGGLSARAIELQCTSIKRIRLSRSLITAPGSGVVDWDVVDVDEAEVEEGVFLGESASVRASFARMWSLFASAGVG
jgi:hypothetical protein